MPSTFCPSEQLYRPATPSWLSEMQQAMPMVGYPHRRLRRLREEKSLRLLVQEQRLHPHDLVMPYFVVEGHHRKEAIESLPGSYRYSLDLLEREIEKVAALGIRAVALFPVVDSSAKDPLATVAFQQEALAVQAIRRVRSLFPELCLIADIALDPFTDHGHDGVLNGQGQVDNDRTIEQLMALSLHYAEAGAQVLAPSDMMDGRIGAIRRQLDQQGFEQVALLAYGAKYSSSYYAPFREAVGSSLRFGDKKGYQLSPANRREALLECLLDEQEGADIVMVKPALPYLDVIYALRQQSQLPIAAFHVSGEWALIQAAAAQGWVDRNKMLMEQLIAIKRAGADLILSWAADHCGQLLQQGIEQ